jgi:hypothetical protein
MTEDGHFTRRRMMTIMGAGAVAGCAPPATAAKAAANVISVLDTGADPSGTADSSPAFQKAIDALTPNGGTVFIPPGNYHLSHMLEWYNPVNRRQSGILFQGHGVHSTVLTSRIRSGPVLRVRGVPTKPPVDTSFFWGGGIRDLTVQGSGTGQAQHGLEILGWYYGEIVNCRFVNLSGDGIRALIDPSIDSNPDWTSSTLFLRAIWLERLGGWGFRDLSPAQGAPAWSWDRCVFALCRGGGALVRSGGHNFTKCSFSACGWRFEKESPVREAYGLYFDGAATANSQHLVEGCEFDANRTAHIGARFLSTSSFLNNRFIFSDRFKAGEMWPRVGVEIGSGDAAATVRAVQFRQSFFRFDLAGDGVAFDFANSANVRDIDISGSIFSAPNPALITRYRGRDPNGRGGAYGFRIADQNL